MGGFILFFWLILKGPRPKLSLNSPRNCWQGGKEVWWVVCVCVCRWGSYYFLSLYHSYLSNICQENIYQINVINICMSWKRMEGLKVRSTEKMCIHIYIYESCLINCDLANPSTPIGGVHQRFLSPDILTTGGCIKKKYMTHCWECPHKKRVWNIFGSVPIRVGWVWGNVNGTMSAIMGV